MSCCRRWRLPAPAIRQARHQPHALRHRDLAWILAYTGDMGAFTFTRLRDMLDSSDLASKPLQHRPRRPRSAWPKAGMAMGSGSMTLTRSGAKSSCAPLPDGPVLSRNESRGAQGGLGFRWGGGQPVRRCEPVLGGAYTSAVDWHGPHLIARDLVRQDTPPGLHG